MDTKEIIVMSDQHLGGMQIVHNDARKEGTQQHASHGVGRRITMRR